MLRIEDPSTGEIVGSVPASDEAEVVAAVRAADAAFAGWRRTAAAERGGLLRETAQRMLGDAERLSELNARETGKLIGDARGGVAAGIAAIEQYAELGPLHRGRSLNGSWQASDFMVNEPRGTVAVITPWNDPVAISAGLIAAALITGNTVVFKPSERAPHVGAALAAHFQAVLPRGTVQLIQGGGTVGSVLVRQPSVRVIAHVGSTAAGRSIAAAAAQSGAKILLENGGKDALIVDAGVNPMWAATQAALGAFANAGQICTSVERIFVVRDVADAFVDGLVEQALSLQVGGALDPDTRLGPLVDRRHREHVHRQVTDAISMGAKPLVGGLIADGPGAFYAATVLLDDRVESKVWKEETFGPVAPVHVVDDFRTAIGLANGSNYGLAATVLTPSLEHAQKAWRELDVATVKINAVFGGAPGGAAQPRHDSGSGYGYGPELLDELTQTKVVHLSPLG